MSISALFSGRIDRTETVCGKYPSSVYVTVNPSLRGTGNAQGVRHRPPLEGRASAPGGLDWMVNVAVEGGSNRSMVGTFKFGRFEFPAEQFASPRPHIAPTIARDILMSALLAQKHRKNVARMNEVKSGIGRRA
jgi:hypothetical protein